MSITIKHIKQALLLLSAFSTLSTYSRTVRKPDEGLIILPKFFLKNPVNIKVDETTASIARDFQDMFKKCESHCSSFKDASSKKKYEEEFIKDYLIQRWAYLLDKYTRLCASKRFDKKWCYKTGVKTQDIYTVVDRACRLWVDHLISNCAQKCLAQYDERAKSVLKTMTNKVEKVEENNLTNTMLVEALKFFKISNNP